MANSLGDALWERQREPYRVHAVPPRETVKVRAYDLVPGNVIVNSRGTRETVATVHSEPAARSRRIYVVTFEENEPHTAPARFSPDDVFDVERVN